MNNVNRRLLVAAVFHFAHPVKKGSYFKTTSQVDKQTSFKMLYEFSA